VTLTRRQFILGTVALAACSSGDDDEAAPATATSAPATTAPPVPVGPNPFVLGVASGDPDTTSVVLWTRLVADGLDGDVDVRWQVLDGDAVVADGEATAEARWGHSVHVVADGLEAGTAYTYRFTARGHDSPTGSTLTAPADDDRARLSLAVASCQRYDDGHWAAHRDIAEADVDLVVFLGDYIYESQQRQQPVRPLPFHPEPAVDLAGYRARYEAARLDADLRAAHAAHPWAVTWDDHEVENDHAGGAGVDPDRRAAAYQAWWEHMPVRFPPPEGEALAIHRSLRWGSLAELLLLDTRQHRVAPACGSGIVDTNACAEIADADRTMLGPEQEAWLLDRLGAGADVAWKVLAQSVVFAPIQVAGQVNGDAWDGYPAARDRVAAAFAGHDALVLTGDIHVQMAVDVLGPDGAVVAAELVAPSISSRVGDAGAILEVLPSVAPHVRHANGDRRGWLRCDLTTERCTATFREVVDVADRASDVVDGASFEVVAGTPGLRP
jgi:alkaline phosphatase D